MSFFLCLLVSPVCPPLLAQTLSPNARVRITTDQSRTVGVFVEATGESIALRPEGSDEVLTIDLEAVRRVETSLGKRSHAGKGVLIGGLIGAGVAALVNANREASDFLVEDREGLTVIMSTVAGVGLGALVGAMIRTERWDDVDMEKLAIDVSINRGRIMCLAEFVF
jgi:hypothetical protein